MDIIVLTSLILNFLCFQSTSLITDKKAIEFKLAPKKTEVRTMTYSYIGLPTDMIFKHFHVWQTYLTLFWHLLIIVRWLH